MWLSLIIQPCWIDSNFFITLYYFLFWPKLYRYLIYRSIFFQWLFKSKMLLKLLFFLILIRFIACDFFWHSFPDQSRTSIFLLVLKMKEFFSSVISSLYIWLEPFILFTVRQSYLYYTHLVIENFWFIETFFFRSYWNVCAQSR